MTMSEEFEQRIIDEQGTAANLHKAPDGEYESEITRVAWRVYRSARADGLRAAYGGVDLAVPGEERTVFTAKDARVSILRDPDRQQWETILDSRPRHTASDFDLVPEADFIRETEEQLQKWERFSGNSKLIFANRAVLRILQVLRDTLERLKASKHGAGIARERLGALLDEDVIQVRPSDRERFMQEWRQAMGGFNDA